MASEMVNLVVRMPAGLRKQARAAAIMRGETIADVVRRVLAEYVALAEQESRATSTQE